MPGRITESEWVEQVLQPELRLALADEFTVETERKLPYAYEVLNYDRTDAVSRVVPQSGHENVRSFAVDLVIGEDMDAKTWRPRVAVEVKLGRINTHAAITYSQKALLHKTVSPHLRYGVLLADWNSASLPGRLIRHGAHFDFMVSLRGLKLTEQQVERLTQLIRQEASASRRLEELLYAAPGRGSGDSFCLLHRALQLA